MVVLEVVEGELHPVVLTTPVLTITATTAREQFSVHKHEADEFIVDEESELFRIEIQLNCNLTDTPGTNSGTAGTTSATFNLT